MEDRSGLTKYTEIARKMFVADLGFTLVAYDLAQAEVRLVAWFAKDERLKSFLLEGGDIHKWNASLIFNKKMDDIKPDERYFAKRIVHAFNYGLGPMHLVDLVRTEFGLEWAKSDATRVRESYFRNSPRILPWHEEIRAVMDSSRVLVNPLGRRRSFFSRSGDDLLRKMIAFLPQSTCVDHLNSGMVRVDLRLKDPAIHLLQVHDEGVLECLPEQLEEIVEIIKEEFKQPICIDGEPMVIPVEIKVGPNWGQLVGRS